MGINNNKKQLSIIKEVICLNQEAENFLKKKNSRIVIIAENVQLLGGKSENGGGFDQPSGGFAPKFQPRQTAPMTNAPSPMDDIPYGEDNTFPEDIPF